MTSLKAFIIQDETDKLLAASSKFKFSTVRDGILGVVNRIDSRIAEYNAGLKGNEKLVPVKEVPVYVAASVCHKLFTIREIVPSGVDADDGLGILAIYHEGGEYRGTYRNMELSGPYSLESLAEMCNPTNDDKWFKEFSRKMRIMAKRVPEECNPNLIAMNDCIFDYKNRCRVDFSPAYVYLNKNATRMPVSAPVLPVIQTDDGGTWDPESWLAEIMPDEVMLEMLLKVICAALRPFEDWQKMFIFYNEQGSNGKGTILEMLRALVGAGNVANIPLKNFGTRFGMESAIGKHLNCVDENDVGGYVDSAANLKAAISNDSVSVDRKGIKAVSYKPNMVTIQCMNELPRIKDKSDSMLRRMVMIKFESVFKDGVKNKAIKTDYVKRPEVLEWFVWKLFMEMDQFWEIEDNLGTDALKQEYRLEYDSVALFWDTFKGEFLNDFIPFPMAHLIYCSWVGVVDPSGKRLGQKGFTRRLSAEAMRDGDWEVADGKNVKLATGNWFLLSEPLAAKYAKSKYDSGIGKEVVDANDALGEWCYPSMQKAKRVSGLVRKDVYAFCLWNHTSPRKFIGDHCSGVEPCIDVDVYEEFRGVVDEGADASEVTFAPKMYAGEV